MELRKHPRRRTLLSGKLVFEAGARSIDCLIRDMSESGAKIRLPGPELLPSQLWLIEMSGGVAHQCHITWRHQQELGLEFERSESLKGAVPADLTALRRLWVANVLG